MSLSLRTRPSEPINKSDTTSGRKFEHKDNADAKRILLLFTSSSAFYLRLLRRLLFRCRVLPSFLLCRRVIFCLLFGRRNLLLGFLLGLLLRLFLGSRDDVLGFFLGSCDVLLRFFLGSRNLVLGFFLGLLLGFFLGSRDLLLGFFLGSRDLVVGFFLGVLLRLFLGSRNLLLGFFLGSRDLVLGFFLR